MEVNIHIFLTLELDRGEWPELCSGQFVSREITYDTQTSLVPARSGECGNNKMYHKSISGSSATAIHFTQQVSLAFLLINLCLRYFVLPFCGIYNTCMLGRTVLSIMHSVLFCTVELSVHNSERIIGTMHIPHANLCMI
jgi:hypothetical protein